MVVSPRTFIKTGVQFHKHQYEFIANKSPISCLLLQWRSIWSCLFFSFSFATQLVVSFFDILSTTKLLLIMDCRIIFIFFQLLCCIVVGSNYCNLCQCSAATNSLYCTNINTTEIPNLVDAVGFQLISFNMVQTLVDLNCSRLPLAVGKVSIRYTKLPILRRCQLFFNGCPNSRADFDVGEGTQRYCTTNKVNYLLFNLSTKLFLQIFVMGDKISPCPGLPCLS